MKKRGIEIGMAVLMLVCFYILSREAAEATEKLKDVSGNIQAGQVILVDAGHGGIDSGMVGIEGLKEKGINLEIAIKLKAVLEKRGFTVMIKEYAPVLSVSIHQNSYSDPQVKGPQVFYYADSENGRNLALAIQEELNRQLSVARPREAKGNRTYYLLKRSPSVINIVECGFLTNPEEAQLLKKEEYQTKIAMSVADGIDTYLASQEEHEKN